MKLLMENWRKYLKEAEEPEGESANKAPTMDSWVRRSLDNLSSLTPEEKTTIETDMMALMDHPPGGDRQRKGAYALIEYIEDLIAKKTTDDPAKKELEDFLDIRGQKANPIIRRYYKALKAEREREEAEKPGYFKAERDFLHYITKDNVHIQFHSIWPGDKGEEIVLSVGTPISETVFTPEKKGPFKKIMGKLDNNDDLSNLAQFLEGEILGELEDKRQQSALTELIAKLKEEGEATSEVSGEEPTEPTEEA